MRNQQQPLPGLSLPTLRSVVVAAAAASFFDVCRSKQRRFSPQPLSPEGRCLGAAALMSTLEGSRGRKSATVVNGSVSCVCLCERRCLRLQGAACYVQNWMYIHTLCLHACVYIYIAPPKRNYATDFALRMQNKMYLKKTHNSLQSESRTLES